MSTHTTQGHLIEALLVVEPPLQKKKAEKIQSGYDHKES